MDMSDLRGKDCTSKLSEVTDAMSPSILSMYGQILSYVFTIPSLIGLGFFMEENTK